MTASRLTSPPLVITIPLLLLALSVLLLGKVLARSEVSMASEGLG